MKHHFNERSKQVFKKAFDSLTNNSFTEDIIKDLLVSLRPFPKDSRLIFEIASFIAHPEERNKGICHSLIDNNYAKLIYVHANDGSNKIDITKIPDNIFQSFIIKSIDDYSEIELQQKLSISKKEAKRKIQDAYTKINGVYTLNNPLLIPQIQTIIHTTTSVLKFRVAFNNDALIKELQSALNTVNSILDFNYNVPQIIKRNKSDIIVCILCLLHSSQFRLFDGSMGTCYLSLRPDIEAWRKGNRKWVLTLTGEVNIRNSKFSSSIMELNEDCSKYVPQVLAVLEPTLIKLPFFNAVRNEEGQLVIESNSIQLIPVVSHLK